MVGVLVQCNYGTRDNLRIAGIPVGREIPAPEPYAFMPSDLAERGSIIVVVATDAPLLAHQLKRLAHRVTLGLGPQRQHFGQRIRGHFHRIFHRQYRRSRSRTRGRP